MTDNSYRGTPFDMSGKVCVVTGALGLLGREHCLSLASAGAKLALIDVVDPSTIEAENSFVKLIGPESRYFYCDISDPCQVAEVCNQVLTQFGRIDVLINNAANNPKMNGSQGDALTRLETYPVDQWNRDLAVGLTGSMLCSREFGSRMARSGGGVIVNIASDLGLIAPNQSIYEKDGLDPSQQPRKPVSYSVVKAGLIGMTRYFSTYWTTEGVRCNALAPGGIFADQEESFVSRITDLIPLGRMAGTDEYRGAVLFLSSDAARYMNGAVLIVDGGRTAW